MTAHPAVQNAAEALLCGWDPLDYLRASGVERLVADAVLRQAAESRREEMDMFARAIAGHLGQLFAG
jgi:hypothetical protein